MAASPANTLKGLSIASALILMLSACADFNTVGRTTKLPKNGKAVHLDAPQRLVYSSEDGSVCAEPSPDALQAYASSFNASVKTANNNSANLATALAASSGSIGLRTQAITLMRDALYRICEARYNKAISATDTVLLLERSQDLTLGVLAIEQLTGAVVARQVALSAGPNADAANNVNNTSTALDAAQKDEASKKDALTKATDTQTKQKTVVDTDTKNAAASKAKAKPTQDVIDKLRAAQPDDQKQLTTLTSQATAESAAVKTDEATVSTLTDKLKKLSQTQPIDQAAITKISGQLDSAKKTLEDAQSKLLEANTAVTKKTASNKEAEDKIATAEKDATVVQATKDAESLKEAEATLAKDKDAVTTATAAYESAQKATAAIQANVKSAVNSAQNVADGKGVFSTGTDRDNINQFTVTKIAEATTTIVDKVLNKGHLTDACINLLTAFSTGKVEHPEDARVQKTLDICAAVVTADLSHFGQPEAIDAR